jgi:hypothetical protein
MSHARLAARPAVVLVAVALAATLVAVGLQDSAAGRTDRTKPKPAKAHLVFTRIAVTAPAYGFADDPTTFTVDYTIKNTGTAMSDRERVHLRLNPRPRQSPDIGYVVINSRVPRLAPGRSFRGVGHGVFHDDEVGAYGVFVCGPRCFSKRRFYVVEKEWVGQVHGVGPAFGASQAEHWDSLPATLDFARYLGRGAFHYDFKGTVDWTDHGVNSGGCLWDGKGSLDVDENNAGPGIVLDYRNGFYKGKETLHDRFYTVTASGGGGFSCDGQTAQGPATMTFLNIPSRRLGFGQKALKGQFGAAGGESTLWKWNFK